MTPETLRTLDQYAFVILPALLVAEQFGIPLPAAPALLGFGALVAHGRGNIPLMLSTLAAVALIVDFAWYELGRRRGAQVLRGLGRLSLEPDCMRRAEKMFVRYGALGMLVAKFVPGLTMVLPPLAGVFAVGRVRFAAFEIAGVLLWAGTWIGVGYTFSDAVAVISARVEKLGLWLVAIVAALLGAYIVSKYLGRRLYLRRLGMAPISPGALKRRLDVGENATILDLRTPLEAGRHGGGAEMPINLRAIGSAGRGERADYSDGRALEGSHTGERVGATSRRFVATRPRLEEAQGDKKVYD
jgi:membrane protein DedA with SNARE-associated domain